LIGAVFEMRILGEEEKPRLRRWSRTTLSTEARLEGEETAWIG